MSIFTLKESWSLRTTQYSLASPTLLTVGNILHEFAGDENQLVVADKSGRILIIVPEQKDLNEVASDSKGNEECFLIHDTRLEILDLKIGRFLDSESDQNALAVVHQNQVSVFIAHRVTLSSDNETCHEREVIVTFKSRNPRTDYLYELTHCFDLKFDVPLLRAHVLPAHQEKNLLDYLVLETFGSRIYVCRGSKILTFKDLHDRTVPGPTTVSGYDEIIVTFGTSMSLAGYKLCEVLYSPPVLDSGKELIVPAWVVPFYEPLYQLKSACVWKNNTPFGLVIATGRSTIYVISQDGKVLSSQKLHLSPYLLSVYEKPNAANTNCQISNEASSELLSSLTFMVATKEGYLLIFQGDHKIWSARMPWNVIGLAVPSGNFPKKLQTVGRNFPPGLIALLSSEGLIQLSHFGTTPVTTDHKSERDETQNEEDNKPFKLSNTLVQGDTEIEDLKNRISCLTMEEVALLPIHSLNNHSVGEVEIQTKLREDPHLEGKSYLLDALIIFPGSLDPMEYEQIFLTVKCCWPIVIDPPYLNFRSVDASSSMSKTTSFTQSCSLSVSLSDLENTDKLIVILDTSVHLLLTYTKRNKKTFSVEQTKCIENFVTLPFHWFYTGQTAKKSDVTGSYNLAFYLAPELVAHGVRLHKVLCSLWPAKCTGSKLFVQLKSAKTSHKVESKNLSHRGVFLLENIKRTQIRMQSDHPELFGPILKELLHQLQTFCKQTGTNISNHSVLYLSASKSSDGSSIINSVSPDTLFSALTFSSLCDYLFTSLCEHVEARISLATQVASNAVQARHFRALQGNILERIQDQVTFTMTGYDTLLEASLQQLVEGCQSAVNFAQKLRNLGVTVVAMISLLLLLCGKCLQSGAKTSKCDPLLRSLSPHKLLTLVEANESVEVSRGQDVLPEEGGDSNSVSDLSSVGLEEYLDFSIESLLDQMSKNGEAEQKMSSTAVVPDVNKLMQRILHLLKETVK